MLKLMVRHNGGWPPRRRIPCAPIPPRRRRFLEDGLRKNCFAARVYCRLGILVAVSGLEGPITVHASRKELMFRTALLFIPVFVLLTCGSASFAGSNQLSSAAKGINIANAPVPTPLVSAKKVF